LHLRADAALLKAGLTHDHHGNDFVGKSLAAYHDMLS